ncbi:MAG: phosphoglucosamine mutase [Francisellaceae bacterium]|nr:phosphoglucosamine mutase [Francisellaceae bacterium]
MGKRQFFGTDGIRGRVGKLPITPEWIKYCGLALGNLIGPNLPKNVVVVRDTRESSSMIEAALQEGLFAAGIEVYLLGVIPTSAVALLTQQYNAAFGIMISASHNPYYDNGLKFFDNQGQKLTKKFEYLIENTIQDLQKQPFRNAHSKNIKPKNITESSREDYIQFCKKTFPKNLSLKGLKIILDSASGAAFSIAATIFSSLEARVIAIDDNPDGVNINANSGALYPKKLQTKVLAEKADCGIALDGDADRLIMVDEKGNIMDGDQILFIIASWYQKISRLKGGVIGTLMSNLGLEQALARNNIPFARSLVGDRYVLEDLNKNGWTLGGESSGHILCLDIHSTGDGIIASLQVLAALLNQAKPLSELHQDIKKYPQVLINVPYNAGIPILENHELKQAVKSAEFSLKDKGRVLLRLSGTEPIIRIMVEGDNQELVIHLASQLKEVVEQLSTSVS